MPIALGIAFILLVQPVAADNHIGLLATGRTQVTSSTCDATVGGVVPAVLDVNLGDYVLIWYNVSWDDTRQFGPWGATHNFTMIVSTDQSTGDYPWYYQTITYGGLGGFTGHRFDIPVDRLPGNISVYWSARITSTNPLCSDFDYFDGAIQLY